MSTGRASAGAPRGRNTLSAVGLAILWGWLTVGVLDIADAMIFQWATGNPPTRVLQYIASGVIGREAAFAGGTSTEALGLALHFLIALIVATVYVVASLRLPWLIHRPIVWGTLYGLGVNAVMRSVVLPLAGFQVGAASMSLAYANLIFAHVFCVGLPISLTTRRYLREGATKAQDEPARGQP
jgi:uncharacterized membrane protein YagU involved in acid resistance